LYRNYIRLNHTLIWLDLSISIRHLRQKKLVQFFFWFLPQTNLPQEVSVYPVCQQNKSALTAHASHDNHVINWPASTILDRELDRGTRWIKLEVHIRKERWHSMNQDEGSYTLSHTYDRFLEMSQHYRGKNQKN